MSAFSRILQIGIVCAPAALLPSCATPTSESPAITPTLTAKPPGTAPVATGLLPQGERPGARDRVGPGPVPPVTGPDVSSQAALLAPPLSGEAEALALEQVSLSAFINEVFANALKLTVHLDPKVASRTDLVTLRTGKALPAKELYGMATTVLASYGIAANWDGTVLNIIPTDALMSQMPEVIRSRALPELPSALRPVFQAVDLNEVSTTDMATWLNTVYGSKVKVLPSAKTNLLLLFGLPADVRAAVEAVQVLDRSRLAGKQSLRISPIYWSAPKLAEQLVTVLKAEGYDASASANAQGAAIMVIPIESSNSLIILASDPRVLGHVREWIDDFDRPANADPQNNIFLYSVQNTTAQSLGQTVLSVVGSLSQLGGATPAGPEAPLEGAGSTRIPPAAFGGASAAAARTTTGQAVPPPPAPTAESGASQATLKTGTRLIVDHDRNAVIVVGTAQEYERLRPLLTALDVPPLEVLIEVTVAELTLNDNTNLGIQWTLQNTIGNGTIQSLGTGSNVITSGGGGGGGFGLPSSGFNYTLLNGLGQVRLALNALAQNTQLNILSTPRVLARSGASASIQVGSQVPVLTGQTTSSQAQVGGNSGILQSIEYQQTGVLLTVNPVVHSGNRVDLTVSQEVSSAIPNTTSSLSSTPVIQNRDVKTQLSLGDGQTVVLGGMISDTTTTNNEGIPYLKDIPVLGMAFKSQSVGRVRTELLVFITPYVVTNDSDAASLTKQLRDQMQSWPPAATTLQF
jgi:general secretion pathway protein D